MAHEAGKGSKPRPLSVSQEEYNSRWDAIFGRDLEKKEVKETDGVSPSGKAPDFDSGIPRFESLCPSQTEENTGV
jgi:hypothetical protein